MYVVTFYSFKGGVGRTLALVNVAAQLLRDGKRVLIVDFDLEAPGIENHLQSHGEEKPGVVEFVSEFAATGSSPDVRNFVHEHSLMIDGRERTLFVMPAGRQDNSYEGRLASLDWQNLYRDMRGFLLIEDLKAQWMSAFAPDYVLVDSRTGHTDSGGICTRQIPDAVVAMAYPNEQNRVGLQRVVERIRNSSISTSGNDIKMHFVLSRVPTIDDEEDILGGEVAAFSRELGADHIDFIHHYESMHLVNQEIFSIDKPKSRLAKQYKGLSWSIRRGNIKDRDGLLASLQNNEPDEHVPYDWIDTHNKFISARKHSAETERRREEYWIDNVEAEYSADSEVMCAAGFYLMKTRRLSRALDFLAKAIPHEGRAFVAIAHISKLMDDADNAKKFALIALERTDLRLQDIKQAILIAGGNREEGEKIAFSTAIERLSLADWLSLLDGLGTRSDTISLRSSLLRRRNPFLDAPPESLGQLLLHYVGCGLSKLAFDQLQTCTQEAHDDVQWLFNYGMAKWIATGRIDKYLFDGVLSKMKIFNKNDANVSQCKALSLWASGHREEALDEIEEAKSIAIGRRVSHVFSCWSFREEEVGTFILHLSKMRELFLSDPDLPAMKPEVIAQEGEDLFLK